MLDTPRAVLLMTVVLAGLTASARAQEVSADLQGFGKAKFGMSEAQVVKLYPKMQKVPVPTPAAGQESLPFTLASYTLQNQSFGPLRKCAVTLRFYEGGFTDVQYKCREPKEKIVGYWTKRLGPPPQVSARNAMSWTLGKVGVTAMANVGTFMIADSARSKAMSYSLLTYVMYKTKQLPGFHAETPGAAPTPGQPAPGQPEAGNAAPGNAAPGEPAPGESAPGK